MSSTAFPIVSSDLFTGPRDTGRPVMLVGFQEQANLGLGYLASTLREQGYRVEVFDFEEDPAVILGAALEMRPVLIGFSLIFQFYVDRFRSLMRVLRSGGVNCHFTMGGHFPSLSYRETLELIPELDSVVRFEGELTLLELVDCLSWGRPWSGIQGIAFQEGGEVVTTPLRPLVDNLDRFPYPERTNKRKNTILGRVATSLIASRGCARTCSFCSIHMFYRAVPGKVVRTRKPKHVVEEMQSLYDGYGATIFLFQDDDFPLFGPVWQRWTGELLNELHRSGLARKVIWKMNCRADVVEAQLFSAMRDAGLYLVYMGLESGTEDGLDVLHKQISVEQNIRAVETLKSIGLGFEYGFMLLDPSSTFESVRANVRFLRRIVGDGSAAATFCRMVPYDGTPIKDQLVREGRFKGDINHPEYDFLDPRLDAYYRELLGIVDVTGWIHGYRALSPQLNWAWHETAVLERLFPPLDGLEEYKRLLAGLTAQSNEMLLRIVEQLADVYTDGAARVWSGEELQERAGSYLEELVNARDAFIGRHQEVLMRSLGDSPHAAAANV